MKRIFLFAVAAFCAVACDSEKIDAPVRYGEIAVNLTGETILEVISKAELTAEEAASYNVSILNSEDEVVFGPVMYSEFQSARLPLGKTYNVFAESCTPDQAESLPDEFGQIRYAGESADITLTADDISQTADVICTVANAMVTVSFDSSVTGRFSNLKVTLASDADEDRVLTVAESASDKVAYFNPATVTYSITGTFNETGNEVNLGGSRTLSARNNLRLLVKVNLDNGQITGAPSITVDSSIDGMITIEEEYNPYN